MQRKYKSEPQQTYIGSELGRKYDGLRETVRLLAVQGMPESLWLELMDYTFYLQQSMGLFFFDDAHKSFFNAVEQITKKWKEEKI